MPPVKPRRSYDSSRRQALARESRLAMLDAARALFLERGYAATTMSSVAAAAGVSTETVYKTFGNKPGLVKSVFDVSVVGDDEPVPMLEREFVRSNKAELDPRQKLIDFGLHVAEVGSRSCPIQLVVRDAASSDAGAADVWQQLLTERLTGMTAFASHLHNSGLLRTELSMEEAHDVLWLFISVELWDLLVKQRGWTDERFGQWVGQQLIASLL